MKRALITGVTGQDGSYLSEFLLSQGYEVHGLVRRTSTLNRERIDHLYDFVHQVGRDKPFFLHYCDLTDGAAIMRILEQTQPDEIYNLAAQSHVKISFEIPEYTANVTGLGTLRILEAIRELGLKSKFYQAGSSEMFGKVVETPQKETTPFYPRSPYGVAKLYSHWITINYREAYGIFACNGILFNHESPRRGENFVTRKISLAAAAIKLGLQDELILGNLDAKRDWGYAKDYVEAMWLMLQHDEPDDYVVATNETHSVREFCEAAFGQLDLDYRKYVKTDEKHHRPTEVELLLGDYSKAKSKLGWEPKTKFKDLVRIMVDADLKLLSGEKVSPFKPASDGRIENSISH